MRDHLRENTDRHFRLFDAMMKQMKAKDTSDDTELVDESTLNLEDFKAKQCREYETKNHYEPNSLTWDGYLYDKGIFTIAELNRINNDLQPKE